MGGFKMELIEAMNTRISVRAYKSEPVPKEIIKQLLKDAVSAPSAMNTQPWEFLVITGKTLDKIRKTNIENLRSGAPIKPDHLVVGWTNDSIYRRRQIELAKGIFKLMDINREDNEKRAAWLERGFRFFDAPAAIIIMAERSLGDAPLMDIGAVMQNICLAALPHGLGTCIEDQGSMYPDVIRKYTKIPDTKRIMISIAIGYPDWNFPVNKLKSARESVDDITTWRGFD